MAQAFLFFTNAVLPSGEQRAAAQLPCIEDVQGPEG